MLNNTQLNLVLADICVDILNNVVSSDESFTKYRDSFDIINLEIEFKHLIASRLIKQLKIIYPSALSKHGKDATVILYEHILNKINILITPININFFIKYTQIDTANVDLVSVQSKIDNLKDCLLGSEKIGNAIYEVEYYNIMLNLFLLNLPNNIDEIPMISSMLKDAMILKDSVPKDLINY